MFVDSDDLVSATFFLKNTGKYKLKVIKYANYKALPDLKRADVDRNYERHTIGFKPLSWRDHNELRRVCVHINTDTGMREMDYDKYVIEKLRRVLRSWDFTIKNEDDQDVPMPCTPENIDMLHPQLAEFILELYDAEMELSQDELKKS